MISEMVWSNAGRTTSEQIEDGIHDTIHVFFFSFYLF